MTIIRKRVTKRVRYRVCFLLLALVAFAVLMRKESSFVETRRNEWVTMMEGAPYRRTMDYSPTSIIQKDTPTFPRIFPTANNMAVIPSLPLQSIQKIHVLGERNSGTKFVGKLLRTAFGNRYSTPSNKTQRDRSFITDYETNIPIYKYKHMFRHGLLNAAEVSQISALSDRLWLLVVRNPCDWVDGMYRKPWHFCPQGRVDWCMKQPEVESMDQTNRMTREQFLQANWSDWAEVRHYQRMDLHANSSFYNNMFALRTQKLRLMFQLMQLHPHNVQVVNLNDISARPDMFLQQLVDVFGLKVRPDFNILDKRNAKVKTSICLPKREWALAQDEINWELEAHFGYSQLDCRLCAQRHDKTT